MATSALDAQSVSQIIKPQSDISQAVSNAAKLSQENSALSNKYAQEQRDWQSGQTRLLMDYNASEATKNRDWQQMMSNTAHQREIKDLQAAGLNPVLSASGGNGAAVTSGATASASGGSGSKGEVDTSANSAIVGILSSWLQSTTALQNAQVSAQANLAVADKYNAMSELVANLAGKYGLAQTVQAGKNAVNTANVQASAAAALSAQGHQQSMDYTKNYPSNPYQLGAGLAGQIAGTDGLGYAGGVFERVRDYLFGQKGPSPQRGPGRGGAGRTGR